VASTIAHAQVLADVDLDQLFRQREDTPATKTTRMVLG